jgi:hypothetical protein
MSPTHVMIVTSATEASLQAVLDAIASAGGGVIGHYTHCSFTVNGIGTFKPGSGADPHVDAVGELNRVPEIRIETFCNRGQAKGVVQAIRAVHPYEEPVIYVIPLLDEAEL